MAYRSLSPHGSVSIRSFNSGTKSVERLVEGDPMKEIGPEVGERVEATHGQQWEPGYAKRFPWTGFLSILGSTGCAIGGIVVLVTSDGKTTNDWDQALHLQPAVYLAILSVLANAFLIFALSEGLVISFWRTALHGCTLADLHYIWNSGHTFAGAVQGAFRKRSTFVSIACIFVVISVMRGPLNQRATTVKGNHMVFLNGTTAVHIAPALPSEYGGYPKYSRTPVREITRLTPNLTQVMMAYSQREPIRIQRDCGTTCGGSMETTVRSFGFNISCAESVQVVDRPTAGGSRELFRTSTELTFASDDPYIPSPAWITVGASMNAPHLPASNTSQASVRRHICDLRGGTVSVALNITDGQATFVNPDWRSDAFVEEVELLGPTKNGGLPVVIGGFQYALDMLFNSSAVLNFGGAVSSVDLTGSLANQYVVADGADDTALRFNDPMDEILNAVREIALRASIAAADEAWTAAEGNATALALAQEQSEQNVPYQGSNFDTIYKTDRTYLAISVLISLLSVVAVSMTFWGYWELGRNVSFSPLEIAKAFDADMLRHVGDNVESEKLVKSVRDQVIQYGEVEGERRRLRIDRKGDMTLPRRDTMY